MAERWFSDEELEQLSRPTMDRAIEAIDAGDGEEAKRRCEEMKHESQFMHDLLVDGVAGLISFVKDKLGDDAVEEAWTYSLERSWKRPVETIAATDRRQIARSLAATTPSRRHGRTAWSAAGSGRSRRSPPRTAGRSPARWRRRGGHTRPAAWGRARERSRSPRTTRSSPSA